MPICKECYDNGCIIIVRGSHQNARAKRTRLDAKKRLEALREEDVVAQGLQEEASEEPAPTQTKRKKRATRKRHSSGNQRNKRSKANASNKP